MAKGKLLVIVLVGVLLAGCGGGSAARQEAMAEAANLAEQEDYYSAIDVLGEYWEHEEVELLLQEYHLLLAKKYAEDPSEIWEAYEVLLYFKEDPGYEAYLKDVVDVFIGVLDESSELYINLTFLESLENKEEYQEVFDKYWFQAGVQELENGELENAKDAFSRCGEEAGEYRKKIAFVEGLRGTWVVDEDLEMVIDGAKYASIFYLNGETSVYWYIMKNITENSFNDVYDHLFILNEEGELIDKGFNRIYVKTSDSVETPEPYKKPNPAVGMTVAEIMESSWGWPDKVNTTVTAEGTREQWVYGNGRYIYFEKGVVTTIQY